MRSGWRRPGRALQSGGAAFSTTFVTRSGAAYAVEGRRAASGDAVLWLLDASAAVTVQRARQEVADLRQMLDAIPLPVWRRGPDRILVDCNRAYASALDTTADLVVAEGRELASGARPGECRHVVIGGSRRLVEIGEVPCSTGGTIGFACDRTDREAAEAELWRHINAHAEVLETIRASVAIYGPDKRLKFFNAAFASMWGIAEDWLAAQPSFEEVLERLREARRLPEAADFRAFKCEQLGLFTSVIRPQQDLLHLPDGRTLLLSISPHPFGGLTFVYEDVSDRLALERSCNTLTKVRRATLDHLFEGIAVYGSDGRLKLHNPAYLALWELSEDDVAGEPHIGEILEKTRALLDNSGDWNARKQRTISKVTAQAPASGPVYRTDGSMLQEATVPLPDGNVLVTYLDVTDTAKYERVLRERNEALETAGAAEKRVCCQRLPRVADAVECGHRLCRDLDQPVFRRLEPAAARLQPRHPPELATAAGAHQRYHRPRHDRGGLHGSGDRPGRDFRDAENGAGADAGACAEAESSKSSSLVRRTSARLRRTNAGSSRRFLT